jgi:fatty-acid peroxygenase
MTQPATIPRLRGFDHTIRFLRSGYRFIPDACDALHSDRFHARLMLSPVLCARGEDAARMFYGGDHFTRQGAMPPTVLRLLQDKGSVQGLEGAAHRHRKWMFVDLLMGEAQTDSFTALFEEEWLAALQDWASRDEIVLFDEANLVLTRAICRWTGVPLEDGGDRQMCHELSGMIENAGRIGPRVIAALIRRRRTERRIKALILQARDGVGEPGSPLWRVAHFRDHDGKLLEAEAATVEVLNILRPTVAIGRYIMFAAMALQDHPTWELSLHGANAAQYDSFAEEVRRVYPFFPLIAGVAKYGFDWDGLPVAKGDWMLLDLYGTNRDPRRFAIPQDFDPQRAPSWRDQGYDFIPQGGGPVTDTHRCPGEELTVAVMRAATRMLVERMDYVVPGQNRSMPLSRIPARPHSGFVLSHVRPAE